MKAASKEAAFIRTPNSCDVPGHSTNKLEGAMCDLINARNACEAFQAVEAIFRHPTHAEHPADPFWRTRVAVTLRAHQAAYAQKVENLERGIR
jgi:hypothetical protein